MTATSIHDGWARNVAEAPAGEMPRVRKSTIALSGHGASARSAISASDRPASAAMARRYGRTNEKVHRAAESVCRRNGTDVRGTGLRPNMRFNDWRDG